MFAGASLHWPRCRGAQGPHAPNLLTLQTFYFNFPCIYARYRLSEAKSGLSRGIQKTGGASGVQRLLQQNAPQDGRLGERAGASTLADVPRARSARSAEARDARKAKMGLVLPRGVCWGTQNAPKINFCNRKLASAVDMFRPVVVGARGRLGGRPCDRNSLNHPQTAFWLA